MKEAVLISGVQLPRDERGTVGNESRHCWDKGGHSQERVRLRQHGIFRCDRFLWLFCRYFLGRLGFLFHRLGAFLFKSARRACGMAGHFISLNLSRVIAGAIERFIYEQTKKTTQAAQGRV